MPRRLCAADLPAAERAAERAAAERAAEEAAEAEAARAARPHGRDAEAPGEQTARGRGERPGGHAGRRQACRGGSTI